LTAASPSDATATRGHCCSHPVQAQVLLAQCRSDRAACLIHPAAQPACRLLPTRAVVETRQKHLPPSLLSRARPLPAKPRPTVQTPRTPDSQQPPDPSCQPERQPARRESRPDLSDAPSSRPNDRPSLSPARTPAARPERQPDRLESSPNASKSDPECPSRVASRRCLSVALSANASRQPRDVNDCKLLCLKDLIVVSRLGIEPRTRRLRVCCSAN
jgi:hypothetical protein